MVSLKGGWFPHNNTNFSFLMAVRFISILISLNIVFLIVSLLIVFLPINSSSSTVGWSFRSPLQKAYGKEVDRLTRFGNVIINKGNSLPLLVMVRTKTYTKENILGAWRGSGFIPPNLLRTVLTKLPAYRDPEEQAQSTSPPPVPPCSEK